MRKFTKFLVVGLMLLTASMASLAQSATTANFRVPYRTRTVPRYPEQL